MEIKYPEDLQKCIDFHGHVCPGLVLGYLASKLALDKLKESRAEDEEIVAIVQTDACSADAVQVITGCTFGKGNFIFKDHGKFVFTFLSRKTGEGIRISVKESFRHSDPKVEEILKKIADNTATNEEKEYFNSIKLERTKKILNSNPEDLFAIKKVKLNPPPKAKIERSIPCKNCNEPTMQSKLINGLCKECIENGASQ